MAQEETGVRWYTDPPDVTRHDLRWFTDGSLRFGGIWELRRTGCAIVVVSKGGDLVAFGNAVPPSWVRTAAAAELWSILMVLSTNVTPPDIVTDCLSILKAAAMGMASATAPNKTLATVWSLISVAVDGDVTSLVNTGRLKWMPSHGSLATIGSAIKSDGRPLTAIEWRANRLADALAKAAANEPLCHVAYRLLGRAEALVKHEAAVVGVVTQAANNHSVEVVTPEGRTMTKTVRDSTGVRAARGRHAATKPIVPVAASAITQPAAVAIGSCLDDELRALAGPPERHERQRRVAAARRAATIARREASDSQVRALCARRGAVLRPSSAPPGNSKQAAVIARVRAREVAAAATRDLRP
jgi:hypothetical protein